MTLPASRGRHERVFERLYRRHVDDVYRYALAVLGNSADAEDVTQTAFLNAYRAFQSGQQPEQPLNWLIAITHNVCRQRFRDAARQPREVVLERELAAETVHDEERSFRQEDIVRALAQLSFSQRSALAMRELEGRSYREIALVLGVTEAAVETLIFRARRAFREQLEGSLSCDQAERAISRQLDGMLARSDKGALRAHLRACVECASLARRLRAQRTALRGAVLVPLPQSLASFSAAGGSVAGGAALGAGLAIKAVAFGATALVAAGISTQVVSDTATSPARATPRVGQATPQTVSSAGVVEQRPVSLARAPTRAKTHVVAQHRSLPKAPHTRREQHREKPVHAASATSTARSDPVAHASAGRPLHASASAAASDHGAGATHGGKEPTHGGKEPTHGGKEPTASHVDKAVHTKPAKAEAPGTSPARAPHPTTKQTPRRSVPGAVAARQTESGVAPVTPAVAESATAEPPPSDHGGGPPETRPSSNAAQPSPAATKAKNAEKEKH